MSTLATQRSSAVIDFTVPRPPVRKGLPFFDKLLENTSPRSIVPTIGEWRARGEYSGRATEDLRKEVDALRDGLIPETSKIGGRNLLELFAMRDRLFAIVDVLDKRDGSGGKLLDGKTAASKSLVEAIRDLNLAEREYWP